MKICFNGMIFMVSIIVFQSIFPKNMDLEWGGNSCWFDALMHCLSEYDEMNQFLRDKFKADPLPQSVLDSLSSMDKAQKKSFVENNFARLYIALIDRIHDAGTRENKVYNTILCQKDPILLQSNSGVSTTTIDLINALGTYGIGDDVSRFYCDFFRKIYKSIGNQVIPGMIIDKGPEVNPKMRLMTPLFAKEIGTEWKVSMAKRFERLKCYDLVKFAAFFDKGIMYWNVEKDIVIKGMKYNLFAIKWSWSSYAHTWAYVKSKKDNCWYCYDNYGNPAAPEDDIPEADKNKRNHPAKFVSEDQIEFTNAMRTGKDMVPHVAFYELDDTSKLKLKLIELKKSLQGLNIKLNSLQKKLEALKTKLGELA
jgi:hypothetical protein